MHKLKIREATLIKETPVPLFKCQMDGKEYTQEDVIIKKYSAQRYPRLDIDSMYSRIMRATKEQLKDIKNEYAKFLFIRDQIEDGASWESIVTAVEEDVDSILNECALEEISREDIQSYKEKLYSKEWTGVDIINRDYEGKVD